MRQKILDLLNARLPASLGMSFLNSLADAICTEIKADNADAFDRLKEALDGNYVHISTTVQGRTLHVLTGHYISGSPQACFDFEF